MPKKIFIRFEYKYFMIQSPSTNPCENNSFCDTNLEVVDYLR